MEVLMTKIDNEVVEDETTEIFELIVQDVEDLALALTVFTQAFEGGIVELDVISQAFAKPFNEEKVTIH
jgi:hypothetical protein